MTAIDLNTLLQLVGQLVDSSDKESASDRFRNYLQSFVAGPSEAREYIGEALKHSGDQYNKALQDLINHLGSLLGFNVTYGRYRGVRGQVGFDGFWLSPTGKSIVVEAKTTDVYTVRTDALLGYINSLVSDGRIKSGNQAIGLYVYGRFDSQTSQLENAITVENRRNQLRVVSVSALLDLLELKHEYGLTHEAILDLLLPAPIRIDPIVELIRKVVAQEQERDVLTNPRSREAHYQSLDESSDNSSPIPAGSDPRSDDVDFTGTNVRAVIFLGARYPVSKWIVAFETVLSALVKLDSNKFEEVAPTLVGRKRPYVTADPSKLRQPGKIIGTDLYFETNLSANYLAKLAWELVDRMGYDRKELQFETD